MKRAFREVLEMMAGVFAANFDPADDRSPRQRALALAVGGMVLARAIDDRKLSDEIRDSARAEAFAMSGWAE